jgi:hypothetical protein
LSANLRGIFGANEWGEKEVVHGLLLEEIDKQSATYRRFGMFNKAVRARFLFEDGALVSGCYHRTVYVI